MNKICSNFKIFLAGLETEEKIYTVISIIGIILSLLGCLINLILGLNLTLTLINLGLSIFIGISLYIVVKYNAFVVCTKIIILLLTLVFFPVVWITSGGSVGPATLLYVFNFMIIGILLSKSNPLPLAILNLISVLGLIIFESYNPAAVHAYESPIARLTDYGLFLIIICGVTFLFSFFIMREYNRNIRKLNEAQKELEILSTIDPLSGLCNRRVVMQALEKKDLSGAISMIMIDIDHFKRINDTYGHGMGDLVIKKFAQEIKENLRHTDVVSRFGGEEFLVVLKETNKEVALEIAEGIRSRLESVIWEEMSEVITVSIGVYEFGDKDTVQDGLEGVDKQLYRAKETGRNCVCA